MLKRTEKKERDSIMKKLLNYFIKGLLIFAPTALTVFVVVWTFTSLDKIFGTLLKIKTPGLGLLSTLALIVATGYLASNFLGKKLFGLVEKVFNMCRWGKLTLSAVKDLIEAFAGEKKTFDKPVVASFHRTVRLKRSAL